MSSPHVICLTPTRNESWIVDRFLAAARTWATHLIVADQHSTDGTWETLTRTPGVEAVVNDSPAYDESHRQRLLLSRARAIPGRRILLGLDADEALSANARRSPEWAKLESAAPGTILRFRWANVLPGFRQVWFPPEPRPFGFVDDGSPHHGTAIHSPRVPQPPGAPTLDFEDIVVLHFQYVAWERMVSKQRWYQAWEYTREGRKGPLDLFRQYHHMHGSWAPAELQPLRPEWLAGYARAGVDFHALKPEPVTWWDREVVQLLRHHGPRHFRRVAIWNHDWAAVAAHLGIADAQLHDPRSVVEKIVHRLLASTQHRRGDLPVRGLEKILRLAGW